MPLNNFDNLQTATLANTDLIAVQKPTAIGPKEKTTVSALATQVAAAVTATKDLAVTTGWTDGTNGTGTVEFTFTLGGNALTEPIAGFFYSANANDGLAATALTTGATASKGVIAPILSGTTSHYHFITNATGELDMTLTAAAGSWWIVFNQNDSTLLISDELAITGP